MIHATRPFVVNEWIQTKIDGYEVSGTVEHVGWWSPTIVRGDDREAVHIPNHKFTVSIVRNLTQKSHWRIKIHFGISHLDVSKIPSIVADMRKVLAKHLQVEQRRLHRRVFLDNINPENQALLVLVSCFVKTSHFEEYLRVKEIILLDLLKAISHHHARLATPIRSVQRIYDEAESRSTPFRDMGRSPEAQGRPYLLIEASAIANGQRDTEQPSNAKNGASNAKDGTVVANDGSDAVLGTSGNESTFEGSSDSRSPSKSKEQTTAEGRLKSTSSSAGTAQPKPQLEGLDSMGLNSKDITLLGAAFEKPPANIPEGPESTGTKVDKLLNKATANPNTVVVREDKITREEDTDLQTQRKADVDLLIDTRRPQVHATTLPGLSSPKQETDRTLASVSSAAKPQLEGNLVLGVAIDGPKRTLPLDNEGAAPNDQKELVGSHNGNPHNTVKERRDNSQSSSAGHSDMKER